MEYAIAFIAGTAGWFGSAFWVMHREKHGKSLPHQRTVAFFAAIIILPLIMAFSIFLHPIGPVLVTIGVVGGFLGYSCIVLLGCALSNG